MDDPRQAGQQARGVLIASLDRVPISAAYLAVVKRVLEAHGATLVETADALPAGMEGDVLMYQVRFPGGTTRINGLVMIRSVPFELVFPDGYCLHGAELWPLTLRESDNCLNGLMLAPEDVEEMDKEIITKQEGTH